MTGVDPEANESVGKSDAQLVVVYDAGRRWRRVGAGRGTGEKALRKLLSALLATGALLVFGCGTTQTYEGPKKAAHEVGVLKTNVGEIALDTVWIGKIDGKEIVLAYSELEVLPGMRSIQVNVKRGFFTRSKTMSFEVRAGRTYRVRGEFGGGHAWIEDVGSGETVAGEKS